MALRIQVSRRRFALYATCFGIAIVGALFVNQPLLLVLALVPLVLTVISTGIGLAERYIARGEPDKAVEISRNAQAEVLHTANFVTDTLHFARNQETASRMELFDLGPVIQTTAPATLPVWANTKRQTAKGDIDTGAQTR